MYIYYFIFPTSVVITKWDFALLVIVNYNLQMTFTIVR